MVRDSAWETAKTTGLVGTFDLAMGASNSGRLRV